MQRLHMLTAYEAAASLLQCCRDGAGTRHSLCRNAHPPTSPMAGVLSHEVDRMQTSASR